MISRASNLSTLMAAVFITGCSSAAGDGGAAPRTGDNVLDVVVKAALVQARGRRHRPPLAVSGLVKCKT